MDTTIAEITPDQYLVAIIRQEHAVLDAEIVVQDARTELHRVLGALREAVREHEAARRHLAHLIGCARLEAA